MKYDRKHHAPQAYNAAAATDACQRTLKFLKTVTSDE